jgi:hypothetical protein
MVLQSINENKSWVKMTWQCAFNMQWPNILFVTNAVLPTFQNPEVLAGYEGVGGQRVNPADRPPEQGMLVLRGQSTHFKGNISLTFYTKTNNVVLLIPKSLGFPCDYESLCKATGTFMDSLELRMYAAK